jgi:hypothetical protein
MAGGAHRVGAHGAAVTAIAAAVLPRRSRDTEGVRRTIRYIAMTRTAARYLPEDRARELAASLAGSDEDLITLASITESIERRRRHFGLEVSDDEAGCCAIAVFAAWLEAVS